MKTNEKTKMMRTTKSKKTIPQTSDKDKELIESKAQKDKTEKSTEFNLELSSWEKELVVLGKQHDNIAWLIGDKILIGWENEYVPAGTYERVVELTNLKKGTLEVYVSICRKSKPEDRNENLSHAHHAAVASLEPAAQKTILNKAVKEKLNVAETKEKVAAYKTNILGNPEPHFVSGMVRIRKLARIVDELNEQLKLTTFFTRTKFKDKELEKRVRTRLNEEKSSRERLKKLSEFLMDEVAKYEAALEIKKAAKSKGEVVETPAA